LRLRLSISLSVLVWCMFAVLSAPGSPSSTVEPADAHEYHLRLYHTHTGEHIDVVYRRGDVFLPDAEGQLDHFLRDHRTGEVKHYDPRVFDILSDLATAVGHPGAEIQIICGYRTPWSNEFLRSRSPGVAKGSLHMRAQAIDIRIPGVDALTLRNAALALGRGGVGYYPKSGFVHVDTGRVRTWCYGCSTSRENSN
jgi:uncharacterized protein YcbK (DUF882 family)